MGNQAMRLLSMLDVEVVTDGPHDVALWLSDNPQPDKRYINSHILQLNKHSIGYTHGRAFGYEVDVDPQTYEGWVVMKSLRHNQHGKLIKCPVAHRPNAMKAYQRLLTNQSGPDGKMEELRAYIYGRDMLLMAKHLKVNEHGFSSAHRDGPYMIWQPERELVSPDEKAQVLLLLLMLGVSYAAVDLIRDADGRLYVIDVTLLMGVPERDWLSNCTQEQYLSDNAEMFQRTFLT